ncbi:MAG: hypothetical protein ABI580_13230 [Burkholderiaceae bacterium]
MKTIAICVATALGVLAGSVQAQTAASSVNSTDPIVLMRMKKKDAHDVYKQSVAAAAKERDTKVKAAVDAAVKDATATGKDPIIARRNTTSQAKKATKADYDAAVKAAKQKRDAAYAAAGKP